MAISKILYIGSCGNSYAGKHLKQALDYIVAEHKTGEGRWVSSLNCQKDNAYEQMRQTKMQFGKADKRQGYHMIISFAEGEVDAETAFEVIGKFAEEYLGKDYEAVYSVHDNTEHIHGHIIFNSVSFRTGKKFRYEKGDWAEKIQPITNRLCEEYALSTIEIEQEHSEKSEHYKEWNDVKEGKVVWADMIKRDIDACILQSATYESFLSMLSTMGYEIKNATRSEGKYFAIKPMGMTRFKRCKSLGIDYTEERIRERIETENLSLHYKKEHKSKIVRCKIKRYRRAKLSGIQKKYFKRLYRLRMLKKRPYNQAWKYREELRKMQRFQENYLFLVRHEVKASVELTAICENLEDKKKETAKEKSRIFKEQARMKPLFDIVAEQKELEEIESCYKRGELLFEEEHKRYGELSQKLKKEGYSVEQIEALQLHYRNEIARIREQEQAVRKEERIAKRLLEELRSAETGKQEVREENRKAERVKQPVF